MEGRGCGVEGLRLTMEGSGLGFGIQGPSASTGH